MMRFVWLFVLLIAACSGVDEPSPMPVNTPLPIIEDDAPFYAWDFSMQGLDGETYTLSTLRGQWVIVNFWATWCIPCRVEMPMLETIARDFDDVIVLGVNQREAVDVISAFVDEVGVTFPILIDPDDQVLMDYQVIGLPQTVVIDPDGVVAWRQFGPFSLDDVRQWLRGAA